MRKLLGSCCIPLLLVGALLRSTAAQVPEIPSSALDDIAMVEFFPTGPAILFNPSQCALNPLYCRFIRQHEYGHIMNRDIQLRISPQLGEVKADCFAAQHAAPEEVHEAIRIFTALGHVGDWMHGTGFQRAKRIYDAYTTGSCHW